MFSVGVLYSSHSFLELIRETPLFTPGFTTMFQNFEVAAAESVLQISQACEWAIISADGGLHISRRGEEVLAATSPEARLRVQLRHMISSLRPAWMAHLSSGRFEATT